MAGDLPPLEPAVIITPAHARPAFLALAGDKGVANLALRLQLIEFLVEPLLGGLIRRHTGRGMGQHEKLPSRRRRDSVSARIPLAH